MIDLGRAAADGGGKAVLQIGRGGFGGIGRQLDGIGHLARGLAQLAGGFLHPLGGRVAGFGDPGRGLRDVIGGCFQPIDDAGRLVDQLGPFTGERHRRFAQRGPGLIQRLAQCRALLGEIGGGLLDVLGRAARGLVQRGDVLLDAGLAVAQLFGRRFGRLAQAARAFGEPVGGVDHHAGRGVGRVLDGLLLQRQAVLGFLQLAAGVLQRLAQVLAAFVHRAAGFAHVGGGIAG